MGWSGEIASQCPRLLSARVVLRAPVLFQDFRQKVVGLDHAEEAAYMICPANE